MARRIVIKGTSGAGKTTLSRAVAARLGVPCVELDAHHHGANWRAASPEELRALASRRHVRLRSVEEVAAWLAALPQGVAP